MIEPLNCEVMEICKTSVFFSCRSQIDGFYFVKKRHNYCLRSWFNFDFLKYDVQKYLQFLFIIFTVFIWFVSSTGATQYCGYQASAHVITTIDAVIIILIIWVMIHDHHNHHIHHHQNHYHYHHQCRTIHKTLPSTGKYRRPCTVQCPASESFFSQWLYWRNLYSNKKPSKPIKSRSKINSLYIHISFHFISELW